MIQAKAFTTMRHWVNKRLLLKISGIFVLQISAVHQNSNSHSTLLFLLVFDESPFWSEVGRPSCLKFGSMEWVNWSSGPTLIRIKVKVFDDYSSTLEDLDSILRLEIGLQL